MKRIAVFLLVFCVFSQVAFAQKAVVDYSPEEIKANQEKAEELAQAAKKMLKIDFQVIKTAHFVIFSTMSAERNKSLEKFLEKMYEDICGQFGMSDKESIWAGECPIYAFEKKKDFIDFMRRVEGVLDASVGSYYITDHSGFCHITIADCNTEKRFNEVLVHETTRGFLKQNLIKAKRELPAWVNAGIAEYMTARLVPNSHSDKVRLCAEEEVAIDGADGSGIFNSVELNAFDLGVAHSLVQFMVTGNKKGLSKLVRLIADGASDDRALKDAYNCTQKELYAAWLKDIKKRHNKAEYNRDKRLIRYRPATAEEIKANSKKTMEFAAAAKAELKVNFRHVETDHFLIFSTLPAEGDDSGKFVEDVYKKLCKPLGIPGSENIWAGKCPIYVFDKKEDYHGFMTKVDKTTYSQTTPSYCELFGENFCYIVIGPCETKEEFSEAIVRELARGFIVRYIPFEDFPQWVNAGFVDYLTASVMPQSMAEDRRKDAEKEIVTTGADGSSIFKNIRSSILDYGVAHSVVQFMITKDRKKFTRFLSLLKGETDREALKRIYGWTYKELYVAWLKDIKKKYEKSGVGQRTEKRKKLAKLVEYKKASTKEVKANRKKAIEMADAAKTKLQITFRGVETDHFLIFSARPAEADRSKEYVEEAYKAACEQLGVALNTPVWAGKCPVYIFDNDKDFVNFSAKVDGTNNDNKILSYNQMKGDFYYFVVWPGNKDVHFKEAIMYGVTQGFLKRYIPEENLPKWVNIGISACVANSVMDDGISSAQLAYVQHQIVYGKLDRPQFFSDFKNDNVDQGIAQGIVRYMMGTDHDKFVMFLELLKNGKSDKEAIKDAYGWTQEELYNAWVEAVKQAYNQK